MENAWSPISSHTSHLEIPGVGDYSKRPSSWTWEVTCQDTKGNPDLLHKNFDHGIGRVSENQSSIRLASYDNLT